MRIRKRIILLILMLCIAAIAGCTEKTSGSVVTEKEGIAVLWSAADGSVENTNNFPVVIRMIYTGNFGAETTIWMEKFQPDEKKRLSLDSKRNRFYVALEPGKAETVFIKASSD